jgi:AcrR family transcriptional regulator
MAAMRFSRRALYDLVWSIPMRTAARRLGLSATGLAKICDRLLVPYPTRGYWAKPPGERPARAKLPKASALEKHGVAITGERAASRRARTRLSPQARREQLLGAARDLIAAHGLHAVSLKRVAREVGVSETLAFTYFNSRASLLADLARHELKQMEAYQRAEIARGKTNRTRVELSTVAYLNQIEVRGSVLHILLSAPDVRALLRPERRSAQARRGAGLARALTERYGIDHDFAHGATQALTAASRRTGRLVAMGKLSGASAQRLLLPMIEEANRDLASARISSASRRRVRRAKS